MNASLLEQMFLARFIKFFKVFIFQDLGECANQLMYTSVFVDFL
jgi:hypothetical protein